MLNTQLGLRQHRCHRLGKLVPARHLLLDLSLTGFGEIINARFAFGLGHAPFRFDPSFGDQSVQRRVERALVYFEGVL